MTLVRVKNFNPLTAVVIYCSPEHRLIKLVDLSHDQISQVGRAARTFVESCEIDSMKILTVGEAQRQGFAANPTKRNQLNATQPIILDPLRAASVPIPDGYRNVAWLRNHEAKSVLMAYQHSKTIPVITQSGKEVFRAEFISNSKEGTKYKASVRGIRPKPDGRGQSIGWIREIEAKAVIKSLELEKSVKAQDAEQGVAVFIQFFPKGSIEETTFKSCTRVLRKL